MANLYDFTCVSRLVIHDNFPGRSGSCCARLGNQRFNTIADLGANARPVIDPLQVKAQTLFLTTRYRVEKSESFDVAAIA